MALYPPAYPLKLGLIARSDCGGLSTQTWEFYRHLHPEKVLVVDLGRAGRGPLIEGMYDPAECEWLGFTKGYPDAEILKEFLEDLDVVFSCENTYGLGLPTMCNQRSIRLVVQANPELHRPREAPYAEVVLPTTWERDRIPHAPILPVPINRSVLPFRQRTEARVFYHPIAPAMLDRSGTELVLACLPFIKEKVEIVFRGPVPPLAAPSNVKVWILPNENRPYFDLYPSHADVLLQPRRYGGLNLPMQEAASLGMPVLGIGIPPMCELPHAYNVPPSDSRMEPMKGGMFPVYGATPQSIAARIDWLAQNPAEVSQASLRANEWAERLNWRYCVQLYREFLGVDSADPSHIGTPDASPTP